MQDPVQQQQRNFVRVDDMLPFAWRQIDDTEFHEMLAYYQKNRQFPPKPESVSTLLSSLDVADKLQKLERSDPDLARILSRMDIKLNLLIRLFHPDSRETPLAPTELNLSGSGLAFWQKDPTLKDGDKLDMRIALSTDGMAAIQCYGRVVNVFAANPQGRQKIAIEFDPILNTDRERLIQHIFKRQTEILRTKR